MKPDDPFSVFAGEYDRWYETHRNYYLSELECVKQLLPSSGQGLEVGVGTGRFAAPLGVEWGIDPAIEMLERARDRGVRIARARGEKLPFAASVFDFVLLVVTLCFIQSPGAVLSEVGRVLKERGKVLIGIIDKNSFLGRSYQDKKGQSKFYGPARFFSVPEVLEMLPETEWGNIKIVRNIYDNSRDGNEIQTPRRGYGEGAFVVISAHKKNQEPEVGE